MSKQQDSKLFLLAVMMSSCVVYNSVGVIDENTLNEFAVVVNIGNFGKIRRMQIRGNKGK
jgi:hypothetical protein